MSELTIKDFEGLSIADLTKKLSEVESQELLKEIEQAELDGANRKGAISAINERQGELVPPAPEEDLGTPGEDYPNGPKGEPGPDDSKLGDGGEEEEILDKVELSYEEKVVKLFRESERILAYADKHFRIEESVSDSLLLAKDWLRKLARINDPKTDVKPLEESTEDFIKRRDFGHKNVDEAVKELREDLHLMISRLGRIYTETRDGAVCRTQAWVHLVEARFKLRRQLLNFKG